jgi:maltoporin
LRGKIMKRVWVALLAVLVSQQAGAIDVDIPGYSFAGIANNLTGSEGELVTNWPTPDSSITDTSAATYVYSWGTWDAGHTGIVDTTAYLDLSFDNDIFDGVGVDLSIFVVGANSQSIDITLFDTVAGTSSSMLTYNSSTYTGYNVDVDGQPPVDGVPDPDFGIYVMDIDLADFSYLGTNPVDVIRLGIDYGSATPSLIGGYNTVAVVPVPAAVWLFGSGLVGLAGIARRKRA